MADLLTEFARHLGLTPEEARPALDAALAAVRRALDAEGAVTLDGVGTFTVDGGYVPDAGLVAAVNDEYAGLEPLAEPAPVVVPPVTSFPVVPAGEPAPGPAPSALPPFVAFASLVPAPREPAESDTIDADLTAAIEDMWVPPATPPVAPLDTPVAPIPGPTRRGDREPQQASLAGSAASAPFAATATYAPHSAGRTAGGEAPVEHTDESRRSALWWALPLVALAALAVWLWTERGGPAADGPPIAEVPAATGNYDDAPELAAGGAPAEADGELPTPADEVGPAADPTGAPVEPDVSAGTHVQEPTVAPAPTVTQPRPVEPERPPAPRRTRARVAPAPRPAPPPVATVDPMPVDPTPAVGAPGLYGGGTVDPDAGGVTWVLNSTSAAEARAQVERYRALGFRASVLSAVVEGRRVHRVAVGQFSDIAEARAARHLLPPDAPADTWMLRLDRTP